MNFSAESHYFIKAHDSRVLPVFEKINFDTVKFNTAGNPSISPSELIELWVAKTKEEGINVVLDAVKSKKKELPAHLFVSE